MPFAKVYSAQPIGLRTKIINIEVDTSKGLHSFSIVGLPDKAVEESRDRVGSAIKNSGFKSPKNKNQKVVISLAPADIKKEGPLFDLGIALAYLLASKEISFDPEKKLFLGELSLEGEIRPVKGALLLVKKAKEEGFTEVFLPQENAEEASLIEGLSIYPVRNLKQVILHLDTKNKEEKIILSAYEKTRTHTKEASSYKIDFSEIRGQETAKRGLEIAAAGGHNIAMIGPAGTGKTMLAKAFCSLLPPLSPEEIIETTGIHSLVTPLDGVLTHPPFRAPHHTSSYVSLIGGGVFPRPGEITLAHRGVLFLDEFPEFERRVIETLRQPLEEHIVNISRAKWSEIFPAKFILIAAMNPCPCGNYGTTKECSCAPTSLINYRRKVSSPIMDRIDIWVNVPQVDYEELSSSPKSSQTELLRERILKARQQQRSRFEPEEKIYTNSEMSHRHLETIAPLSPDVRSLLNESATRLNLSARSYHKVIKVARTIADIEEEADIKRDHILEALQYRPQHPVY